MRPVPSVYTVQICIVRLLSPECSQSIYQEKTTDDTLPNANHATPTAATRRKPNYGFGHSVQWTDVVEHA